MESNKNLPLVCVCVPTYNTARTLSETLESILAQTYKNIKIVIVDNASTDATLRIADSFSARDSRVSVLRHAENAGGEGNFTRCIQAAEGDYTAIYHSDDVYDSDIIEKEAGFLEEHKEAGAVFCAARDIDESGKVIAERNLPCAVGVSKGGLFNFEQVFKAVLKAGNFMVFPGAMVRTGIYKDEIKAWDAEDFSTSADLDVWLRIAERHSLGFINKPLMNYRVSSSSYSYNFARLKTSRHAIFLALDHYLKKYAGSFIGPVEMSDYRLLLLKDDTNIAINLLIKDERVQARRLLRAVFKFENACASLRSGIQFKMYLIGLTAWTLSLFPLGAPGRGLLAKIRHNG